MKIGFIGTGVMGKSMVKHLLNANHQVTVFTRTKSKADDLVALGALWSDSVSNLTKDQDYVFTMVGYPKDVEEVYLGANGIIAHANPKTICVDFTTSEPSLAVKIYITAKDKDISVLDAPVSGGDVGAQNATLSIMIGGDAKTFEELQPIWKILGKTFLLQGPAGSGQHTKMVNQILISTNMIGVCESLIYGVKAGLNMDQVMNSVSTGAAASWSLSNLGTRILKEDFAPGFFVEHFVKDMGIALKESKAMGLHLPGLEMSLNLYEALMAKGHEKSGTQALYLHLKEVAGASRVH